MKQVYLDLVDGKHIKVKPLKWVAGPFLMLFLRVEETRYGFKQGEEIECPERHLFCIAGHSKVSGKIKGVVPDLSHLPRGTPCG